MTKFMRMASMLGFEEFLTIFIIFLHVTIDARLSRLYCILMGAAFYVVGFAKVKERFFFRKINELGTFVPATTSLTHYCAP